MIKVADFVSETIKQVIAGVRRAQEDVRDGGAVVNPQRLGQGINRAREGYFLLDTSEPVQVIEFDVAVTSSDATQTTGGVGVFLAPFALGTRGQSDTSNASVSRIRFAVPVLLPKQTN